MGFFKKIGNALGIKSHTVVGKILGTDVGSGGGSAPTTSPIKTQQDLKKVNDTILNSFAKTVHFNPDVAKGLQYASKQEKDSFFGDLLGDLWGNVKDGVNGGVKNAGQTLIDKLTGKLLNSDGSQTASNTISDYATGIMETTLAKYIKRNWFYILFPIIGLMIFAKVLFNGKKRRPRRR